jgi:hypothetical protein
MSHISSSPELIAYLHSQTQGEQAAQQQQRQEHATTTTALTEQLQNLRIGGQNDNDAPASNNPFNRSSHTNPFNRSSHISPLGHNPFLAQTQGYPPANLHFSITPLAAQLEHNRYPVVPPHRGGLSTTSQDATGGPVQRYGYPQPQYGGHLPTPRNITRSAVALPGLSRSSAKRS